MYHCSKINIEDLNPHLMCVLCGGYFIDATTIIECLHSFCRTCIVRYLESSKFCPICDVQVHKTRPLLNIRSDKTLQDLVYKLVPGLFGEEMRRRREFLGQHPEVPTAGMDLEQAGLAHLVPAHSLPDERISLVLELAVPKSHFSIGNKMSNARKVKDRRYLLCPSDVSIGHLKKFILAKFGLPLNFQIDVYYKDKDETISDDFTLLDITFIYSYNRTKPLRLFYTVYQKPRRKRKRLLTKRHNFRASQVPGVYLQQPDPSSNPPPDLLEVGASLVRRSSLASASSHSSRDGQPPKKRAKLSEVFPAKTKKDNSGAKSKTKEAVKGSAAGNRKLSSSTKKTDPGRKRVVDSARRRVFGGLDRSKKKIDVSSKLDNTKRKSEVTSSKGSTNGKHSTSKAVTVDGRKVPNGTKDRNIPDDRKRHKSTVDMKVGNDKTDKGKPNFANGRTLPNGTDDKKLSNGAVDMKTPNGVKPSASEKTASKASSVTLPTSFYRKVSSPTATALARAGGGWGAGGSTKQLIGQQQTARSNGSSSPKEATPTPNGSRPASPRPTPFVSAVGKDRERDRQLSLAAATGRSGSRCSSPRPTSGKDGSPRPSSVASSRANSRTSSPRPAEIPPQHQRASRNLSGGSTSSSAAASAVLASLPPCVPIEEKISVDVTLTSSEASSDVTSPGAEDRANGAGLEEPGGDFDDEVGDHHHVCSLASFAPRPLPTLPHLTVNGNGVKGNDSKVKDKKVKDSDRGSVNKVKDSGRKSVASVKDINRRSVMKVKDTGRGSMKSVKDTGRSNKQSQSRVDSSRTNGRKR